MNKVKLTLQRKAIYDVLLEADDHPTAADIIERLRTKHYSFAYGTVYNSLRYLTDAGLIRELKLGEAVSRYDARMDEHEHIVCTSCGKVDEIVSEIPAEWLLKVAEETGYTIGHAKIVVEGVCKQCASKSM